MKTIFYLFAFCFSLQFNLSGQVSPYKLDAFEMESTIQKREFDDSRPVYFNFSKRRLYSSDKRPINGRRFLEACRAINDPGIQQQIYNYDKLTNNKKKLIGAMIACGIAGYATMMGSLMMSSTASSTNQGPYIGMGIGAAVLFIATPILAISTTIPHQKRKEILFRDLPEAYNFHVLSHNNK